jgi:hypothetical protein
MISSLSRGTIPAAGMQFHDVIDAEPARREYPARGPAVPVPFRSERKGEYMMKHSIAIVSCIVGMLLGSLAAGWIGAVMGAITGCVLGYAYVAVVVFFWEPRLRRFLTGTIGGTVVGGLSGMSVHVPELLGLGEPFWGSGAAGVRIGGMFGLCVGTVLGLILSICF